MLHYGDHQHPCDLNTFRHDSVTQDDWDNFVIYPDLCMLLISNREINSDPPPGLGASGKSSSPFTTVNTFKSSIKRDSSQFTNFNDVDHWDI